jgi:hypothetical protein
LLACAQTRHAQASNQGAATTPTRRRPEAGRVCAIVGAYQRRRFPFWRPTLATPSMASAARLRRCCCSSQVFVKTQLWLAVTSSVRLLTNNKQPATGQWTPADTPDRGSGCVCSKADASTCLCCENRALACVFVCRPCETTTTIATDHRSLRDARCPARARVEVQIWLGLNASLAGACALLRARF